LSRSDAYVHVLTGVQPEFRRRIPGRRRRHRSNWYRSCTGRFRTRRR